MGEDGAGLEAQRLGAVGVCLHHHRADDVTGHQIGCELDARVSQAEDAGERPEQGCLSQTGDAFQQDVPAGEQADDNAVDHILLADDNFGNFCADTVEFPDRLSDISFTKHLFILRQDGAAVGAIVAKCG